MPASMNITFLGTASAQPSSTRNHSALALRYGGDVWLFDCGEATQHQIQKSQIKMGRISKIFITHTHGDHIFGLLPLIASLLNGSGGTTDGIHDPRLQCPPDKPAPELISATASFTPIRSSELRISSVPPPNNHNTQTSKAHPSSWPGQAHELRSSSDPLFGDYTDLPPHSCESPHGLNIQQSNGIWPEIYRDDSISVSAAPILHSAPCVGYVIQESPLPGKLDPNQYTPHLKRTKTPMSLMSELQQGGSVTLSDGTVLHGPPRIPGRKIAILGDTHDPSPIVELAADVDVLIHEATNAHLPDICPSTKKEDTLKSVEARSTSRGHSTPQMAGKFALAVRARKLVLNHFSSRYAGNDDQDEGAKKIMDAISTLAEKEFGGPVVCSRDFMSFDIPVPR